MLLLCSVHGLNSLAKLLIVYFVVVVVAVNNLKMILFQLIYISENSSRFHKNSIALHLLLILRLLAFIDNSLFNYFVLSLSNINLHFICKHLLLTGEPRNLHCFLLNFYLLLLVNHALQKFSE